MLVCSVWAEVKATHFDGINFFSWQELSKKGAVRVVLVCGSEGCYARRVMSPEVETTPRWKQPGAGTRLLLENTQARNMPRIFFTSFCLEHTLCWTMPRAGRSPRLENALGWNQPGAGKRPGWNKPSAGTKPSVLRNHAKATISVLSSFG